MRKKITKAEAIIRNAENQVSSCALSALSLFPKVKSHERRLYLARQAASLTGELVKLLETLHPPTPTPILPPLSHPLERKEQK